MKKAFRIFWGLFILGFVIKFFHIPGGEALFVLSIMTLTILAIIEFVKGIIQKAPLVVYGKLFDLNLILWLGYFVARLRFCPWLLGFLQFCLCIMISAYLMFKLKSNDRSSRRSGVRGGRRARW